MSDVDSDSVVQLAEARDVNSFGGKAVNLAKLLREGLPVPSGLAVGIGAFNDAGHLNAGVAEFINANIDSSKLYAVRSSGVAEDAEGASWAGQFETFLEVKTEDVIEKLIECHNSAKARVHAYAAKQSEDTSDFHIAVVIQEIVQPDYAGVLFTRDPITGDKKFVTEYVEGFGEKLVSGEVDPVKVEWKAGQYPEVPFDIEQLIGYAQKIESAFGSPQDIEWASNKEGLWILQTRPITTISGEDSESKQIDINEGLIALADLLKGWGLSSSDWILSGQYVYGLLGYDVSVRPGHHNLLVDVTKLPWEIPKDALEVYPMSNSVYSQQYQSFIKDTGYEFDMIPFSTDQFLKKSKSSTDHKLSEDRSILIQDEMGQLELLEDILSKSNTAGWGEEKGRRILKLVNELQAEFEGSNKDDLACAHQKVAEKYAYLNDDHSLLSLPKQFQLGDPEDLFYWGPSRTEPLFFSDFVVAAEKNFTAQFADKSWPNPPETIALFHQGQVVWLSNAAEFNRYGMESFEAYGEQRNIEEDVENWHQACRLVDESFKSQKDLFKNLVVAWGTTLKAEFSLYGAEPAISKMLKRLSESQKQEILKAFTVPDKPTFMQRIDNEIKATDNIQLLIKKYPWINDGYFGVSDSAEEYFSKRQAELKNSVQKNEPKLNQSREELINKFGLTETEINTLALVRGLAEFMDDRKAWMMKTRSYLVSLENFGPENGWQYKDGKTFRIDQPTTEKLWKFYIEFKASNKQLAGTVASNAGKASVEGIVRVVSSPTQNVEYDKILVVPSTSPSYVPLMRSARALITDHGGIMSHAAIVAREFGLPCIVGTKSATKKLKNDDQVRLDLETGEITVIG